MPDRAAARGADRALKADKYGRHELGSLRATVVGMRRLGAGSPPLHRFRIGLAFALSGHREVDDLQQSEALAPLGAIAVQHRERLDGSGYPRGLSGGAISRPARILGAADAYQAMREPRPHRSAFGADEAAADLRSEAAEGRLDPDAVEAVLAAAGHRIRRRRDGPFGLTPREVDVLRLLATGLSNKEIAQRLVISPKTVGNHVERIYAKLDVRSRAGAGLFAMQHGLLPEGGFRPIAPVA